MSLFWNEGIETKSQDEIRCIQSERLKSVIEWVAARSEFHRARFKEAGIDPKDIDGLDDLVHIPSMSKADFSDNYPLKMLCVDRKTLREVHLSSGSTGAPVVMAYDDHDLDQWAECMARCYRMAGIEEGDTIQITPSFGLFNGGFGFYHGARKAGLFIIPTGAGNTLRQIKLMNDFHVKAIMGVVSYGIRIMEVLQEINQAIPSLKIGMFGAETFSDSMCEKIENGLGIEAFDIYGMTETGGVGTTGMDCGAHNGIHVWEDQYILEVIDTQTLKPLADGEEGEVVFTSLNRQAIPVIRLRTGDISRVISRDRCPCGRTHARLDRIKGRIDDMLIIKGVNFYPRQIEQALMDITGVRSHYQIIIEDINGVKDLRINVEADEGVTGYMVEKHLKEVLGFSPKGDVFKPGTLPRQEGKAVRVFFEKRGD
ncbi:AMP-binding protein [bacterium]|nr:AMP-binding protein [bacterium]